MTITQRLCAAIVAVECATTAYFIYLIARTYVAVKGKHG